MKARKLTDQADDKPARHGVRSFPELGDDPWYSDLSVRASSLDIGFPGMPQPSAPLELGVLYPVLLRRRGSGNSSRERL